MSYLSKLTSALANPISRDLALSPNPWRELWDRAIGLGPWAQYPKVYEHERAYCAYCGAWAPDHEIDCPYLLAGLLGESDQGEGSTNVIE